MRSAESTDIVIVREFAAPVELVWRSFTDPEMMKHWWGPLEYTAKIDLPELKVGSSYRFCMTGPDGVDIWGTGEYREIEPNKRLVFTDSFADEKGNVVPGTYYGMEEGIPLQMLVTIELDAMSESRTKMTLLHRGFPEGKHQEGATLGWNSSFDKLDKLFESV